MKIIAINLEEFKEEFWTDSCPENVQVLLTLLNHGIDMFSHYYHSECFQGLVTDDKYRIEDLEKIFRYSVTEIINEVAEGNEWANCFEVGQRMDEWAASPVHLAKNIIALNNVCDLFVIEECPDENSKTWPIKARNLIITILSSYVIGRLEEVDKLDGTVTTSLATSTFSTEFIKK